MPKKRSSKRLEELFENIKDEAVVVPAKKTGRKVTTARLSEKKSSSRPVKASTKTPLRGSALAQTGSLTSPEPVALIQSGSVNAPATMSLAFQLDSRNWATLQVADDVSTRLWDHNEQMLVKQVTDQLSQALENARLFQETQQRSEELARRAARLKSVAEISASVSAIFDLQNLLQTTVNLIRESFDLYHCHIFVMQEDRKHLSVEACGWEKGDERAGTHGARIIDLEQEVSLVARAARTRQAVIVNNVAADPTWLPNPYLPRIKSEMAIPVIAGEELVGVLNVHSDRVGFFTDEDILIQTTLASQIGIAVNNARLFQETRIRAEELAILNEMGRELTTLFDKEEIARAVYQYTSRLMDATNLFIALYDEKKQEVNPWFVINDRERVLVPPRKVGQGLSDHIIRTHEPLFIPEDVLGTMKKLGMELIPLGDDKPALSWLGCPLLIGDTVTGVIAVQSVETTNLYTDRHLDILTAIAGRSATALENARLFQETQTRAEELAVLNELTKRLSERLDVNQVLQETYNGLSRLLNVKNFYIGLYSPEKGEVTFPFNVTESVIDRQIVTIRADQGLTGYILRTRAPLVIPNNVTEKMMELGIQVVGEPAKSWLGVPMLLGEQVIGVMAVQSYTESDVYDEHDRDLMLAFAGQATIAIQNARLFQESQQSREALGRSESELRALFTAMTDVIIIYDQDGRYVRVAPTNPSRLFRPPDEMLGKKITEILPASLHQPFLQTIQRALEGSQLERIEYPLTIEGQQYWFEANVSKLTEDQVFWVARDITARKQAEEEIAKFKLGIDQSTDAVFITDTNGSITYANPGFEKVYGFKPEEAIGQNPRIIKSGILGAEVYKQFWATLLNKQTVSGEIINKTKDGRLISIAGANSPILDEAGNILGFLAVHHDITDRKQAEEALKRRNEYLSATAEIGRLVTSTLDMPTLFSRTVNLVRDRFGFYHAGIFITEETGFNALLQAATGEAGAEMKRQKHSLPVGSKSVVGEATDTGRPVIVNDTRQSSIHKPNPLLPETLAETAIPLRVGSRTIGALDIQATTVNAFSEDDIAVLQTLADQIAIAIDNARSYELSMQAVKEMREADRLKSQFLANMSHELRTPLNSIIGFSRVILKGIDGPTTDLQSQDLLAIHNSGQHLLGLINDILDLSRIEAGKMELTFDEVNLPELITSVLSTVTGLIKDKPITIQREIPADLPTVRADAMRVRQVMLNLLSNAAKFTDEGSITVHASVSDNAAGHPEITVSVTDTGPGISPEDQKKLFQPFSQVDASPTRKTGGSGLGLSISNHLIQMHGGTIGVKSATGRGSTFFFTLPAYRGKIATNGGASGNRTILAIDDDPQVISLYERYLQPQGYQLIPLSDPSRAAERARQLKPFAITLDIMMPGYDGWRVLNDLKSNAETRDIPVIVCSIVEEQEKGFSLGAADYLLKPILEDDLLNSLDRLNSDGSIREVLIVDDDTNDLRLISQMLSEHGRYRPVAAQGGAKGWQAIQERTPHAVILDLFMPDLDGFTILEKMRSTDSLRDIPVIVVSGVDLTTEQKKQLQEFGQRMVQKSGLSSRQLVSALERVLKRVKS